MRRTIAACVLFGFLALLTVTTAAAKVPPPQANLGGANLSDWAKRFFVFDASVPVVDGSHPALDEGVVDCSLGQSGKVWFLETAPGIVGEFERRCSIPSGTGLYMPVFQWFCAPELDGIEIADCLVDADGAFEDIDLGLTVDGHAYDDAALDAYRAEVEEFELPLVEDSYWEFVTGLELGDSLEFGADVVGVLLHPLSVGTHEIVVTYSSRAFEFAGTLTYRITVTPGKR